MRRFLQRLLKCRHKHFEYETAGGKMCIYQDCARTDCSGECSIPVYQVYCLDCGQSWTLGENEVMDFFARRRKEVTVR